MAGAVLAEEGLEELAAAELAGEVARDLAAEGVAKVAEGAADLGAADVMLDVSEAVVGGAELGVAEAMGAVAEALEEVEDE